MTPDPPIAPVVLPGWERDPKAPVPPREPPPWPAGDEHAPE